MLNTLQSRLREGKCFENGKITRLSFFVEYPQRSVYIENNFDIGDDDDERGDDDDHDDDDDDDDDDEKEERVFSHSSLGLQLVSISHEY